jgi:hypothetical protein
MSGTADRERLKSRLKRQAAYRWRMMRKAEAAGNIEAYRWHASWRSAICKELRDLTDPIVIALHNHPLTRTSP